VPAIIVGVSAWRHFDDYGTAEYCWIDNRHGALWSFVGPMLGIIAINCVVFVMVMRNVFGVQRKVDFELRFMFAVIVAADSWPLQLHNQA
jgi:Na+-transporting NADH:ubiquinone oxidoreductase subunit NqrE